MTFQPTLPKLLSLDQDYPNLRERIAQAAKIVGLDISIDISYFAKYESSVWKDVQPSENPRREWVFKWLLEKLRSAVKNEDQDKVSFVQNSKVWRLLRLLLPTLPGTVAARLLSTYDFVTLLEHTLLTIYLRRLAINGPETRSIGPGSRKRKRAGSPETKPKSLTEGAVDITSYPPRHLTRGSGGEPIWKEAGYRGEGLDESELLAVSHEILALLQDLQSIIQGTNDMHDLVAREQIRSVLRTSTAQAANITRLLLNLTVTRIKLDSPHFAPNFSPLLLIWEARQIETDEGISSSLKEFCNQLLLPLLSLRRCSRLAPLGPSTGPAAAMGQLAPIMTFANGVEDLMRRHFALPAKKAFKDAQASKAPQNFDYAVLQNLLKSVRDALDVDTAILARGEGGTESDISQMRCFIPSILHANIMPAQSPARPDDIDIPWGENLAAVFAECIGYPLVGQPGKSRSDDEIFANLVEHLVTQEEDDGVVRPLIGAEMMEEVVHRYSGLSKANNPIKSDQILWRVVDEALKNHGDIFLPRKHGVGSSDRKLRAMLLAAFTGVSDSGARSKFDIFDHFHDACDTILSLLEQHIKARDLRGFVTAWDQGLKEILSDKQEADAESRLWTQPRLREKFVETMEASLIPAQVIQLVTDFIGPIGQYRSELVDRTSDDKIPAEPDARAAVYLLTAILDGIKNEETIRQLQPALLAVEQALKGILLSDLLDGPSASWFWKLLIKIYELMSIETDPTVMDSRRAGLFESGIIARAQAHHLQKRVDKRVKLPDTDHYVASPEFRERLTSLAAQTATGLPLVDSVISRLEDPTSEFWIAESEDDDDDEDEDEDDIEDDIEYDDEDVYDEDEIYGLQELPLPDSSAAYQFVMAICAACLEAGENEDEAQNAMITINEHIFVSTAKWGWKPLPGKVEYEARSPELRLCISVLLRYPQLMLAMKKVRTTDLFTTFTIAAAVEQKHRGLKIGKSPWSRHLEALVSVILELGAHNLRDAMTQAIYTACAALGNLMQMPPGFLSICLTLMEIFRPTTMPRKDREAILDLILSPKVIGSTVVVHTLGLAAQILTAPALTSSICSNPECLAELAQIFDFDPRQDYADALPAFSAVFNAVFRQVLADPQRDRRNAFLEGFGKYISEFPTSLINGFWSVDDRDGRDEPRIHIALALSWLEHVELANVESPASDELVSRLSKCWDLYLGTVVTLGEMAFGSELQERVSNSARLVNIAKQHKEDELPHIFKVCDEAFRVTTDPDTERNNKYWNLLTQGLRPAEKGRPADINDAKVNEDRIFDLAATDITAARQYMSIREAFDIDSSLRALISNKSNQERMQLLLDWIARGSANVGGLHLDLMVLTMLQPPQSDGEKEMLPYLQHYAVSLLEAIGTTTSHNVLMRNMRSVKIILKEKPWMITQHTIDTLVATLTKIISPSSSLISNAAFFYEIHDNLCQAFRLVLSLHRRRLNGRLHLVIPLLQALMACLFIPHHTTVTSRAAPTWTQATGQRLTFSSSSRPSIKSYTRCLTMLCSPTVSSVAGQHKNRNRLDLVDQTKKARDHIGLYAPSLLTHFCASQLAGSLHPDLRSQLLPGLWACINVVSEEGLGVMNDAMGRDVRALWHSLYAEYKRTKDRKD